MQRRWDIGLLMACVHLHLIPTACMQHCFCVPFLQQVHAVIPLNTFRGTDLMNAQHTVSSMRAKSVNKVFSQSLFSASVFSESVFSEPVSGQ